MYKLFWFHPAGRPAQCLQGALDIDLMTVPNQPASPVLTGAVYIVLMTVPKRPAGPVLTGALDIDLMTVPKLSKNVPKNVPIT